MNNQKKSYIFLLLGAILIAFSPVLIKATGAPGTVSVFYRMTFGALTLLLPFLLSLLKGKTMLPARGVFFAILAGLSLAIDMSMWATGIMISNAAMPTLVANLAPLWVGIGAFLFLKEKQNWKFWLGIFIALLGVSFLVIQDSMQANNMNKGLFLGLLAGIFYALFMLLTQMGRKYLKTLHFLFISTVATAFFLGLFMIATKLPFTGYSNEVWGLFITMGVVLQAGGWFLINYAQGYLPASLVSPTLLAQPVMAGLIAYILLGEKLTPWQVVGGMVVVVGIYVVHFAKSKK